MSLGCEGVILSGMFMNIFLYKMLFKNDVLMFIWWICKFCWIVKVRIN